MMRWLGLGKLACRGLETVGIEFATTDYGKVARRAVNAGTGEKEDDQEDSSLDTTHGIRELA
jgi:hypothetical protein